MAYDDEQQEEAATDAPEADAGAQGADDAIAGTVDNLAAEKLDTGYKSPQPEGTVGDPIGDAESHIASLDMDEERRKLAEIQKNM